MAHRWIGISKSEEKTREHLEAIFARAAPPSRAGDKTDLVYDLALHARPNGSWREPEYLASLSSTSIAKIGEHEYGAQALAKIALIEDIQNARRVGADTVDSFAAALTTYVAAINRSSRSLKKWVPQTVDMFLCEYLFGHSSVRGGLARSLKSIRGVNSLADRIFQRAPWLAWMVANYIGPPVRTSLQEYLEILVMTRPLNSNALDESERLSVLPQRWMLNYPAPRKLEKDIDALPTLAIAMEVLLAQPATATRRVHGLNAASEVLEFIAGRVARVESSEDALASTKVVRVDSDDQKRIVVVNLDSERALTFSVGGRPTSRLEPNSLSTPRATRFVSRIFDIDDDAVLRVGDAGIPLGVPVEPLQPTPTVTLHELPPDLFQGRAQQLARLLSPLQGSGARAASLIYGPRRAGKSTLAYRVATDPLAGEHLWVDLSDTSTAVTNHAEWNRELCENVIDMASGLFGIPASSLPSHDIVALIRALDGAVADLAPFVLVLDEMDVLLLDEQGADGRRTAGRLGSLVLRNIAIIGTVQRFHHSTYEFKNWESIECPADLDWADGASYFFPPLRKTAGARVEFLTHRGTHLETFNNVVFPAVGLRPYFWARLRQRFDSTHRLVLETEVRELLDGLVADDPHLFQLFSDDVGLTSAERRRQDLFSDDERRILLNFARLPTSQSLIARSEAVRLGGTEAVHDLIGRAYVAENGPSLQIANPVYERFIREHVEELASLLTSRVPDASSVFDFGSAEAFDRDVQVRSAREAILLRLRLTAGLDRADVLRPLLSLAPDVVATLGSGLDPLDRFMELYVPEARSFVDGHVKLFALTEADDPNGGHSDRRSAENDRRWQQRISSTIRLILLAEKAPLPAAELRQRLVQRQMIEAKPVPVRSMLPALAACGEEYELSVAAAADGLMVWSTAVHQEPEGAVVPDPEIMSDDWAIVDLDPSSTRSMRALLSAVPSSTDENRMSDFAAMLLHYPTAVPVSRLVEDARESGLLPKRARRNKTPFLLLSTYHRSFGIGLGQVDGQWFVWLKDRHAAPDRVVRFDDVSAQNPDEGTGHPPVDIDATRTEQPTAASMDVGSEAAPVAEVELESESDPLSAHEPASTPRTSSSSESDPLSSPSTPASQLQVPRAPHPSRVPTPTWPQRAPVRPDTVPARNDVSRGRDGILRRAARASGVAGAPATVDEAVETVRSVLRSIETDQDGLDCAYDGIGIRELSNLLEREIPGWFLDDEVGITFPSLCARACRSAGWAIREGIDGRRRLYPE